MECHTAKLFMNGRSQAIRLPKEFRVENASEVTLCRVGNKIYIEPIYDSWEPLLNALDQFPEDATLESSPVDKTFKDIF